MARIHHVKKAQQRYATKPVIDPETGEQKVTVVMKNGRPKTNKRGQVVTRKITEADKSQPLPPYKCGHCREEIAVGTPYKHVSIKSGPYGGQTLRRHASCPTWKQSELTTSKMAGIYAAQEDFGDFLNSDFESVDDVQSALDDAAEQIRSVAEEYRESAENIREGFGHDTWQSEELDSKADEIEQWADEVAEADIPELSEETECDECAGSGQVECGTCSGSGQRDPDEGDEDEDDSSDEDYVDCEDCDASGEVECDECSGTGQVDADNTLEDWREEVREAVSVVDECPV